MALLSTFRAFQGKRSDEAHLAIGHQHMAPTSRHNFIYLCALRARVLTTHGLISTWCTDTAPKSLMLSKKRYQHEEHVVSSHAFIECLFRSFAQLRSGCIKRVRRQHINMLLHTDSPIVSEGRTQEGRSQLPSRVSEGRANSLTCFSSAVIASSASGHVYKILLTRVDH